MSTDHEEAGLVAALIAGAIARRFADALRSECPSLSAESIDSLALMAGVVAIPVLQTAMTEDDPLAALDEQEALERLLREEVP